MATRSPYFPYASGKVDFKKRAGLIPPLQKLDLKKAIKAAVPADVDDGIEPRNATGDGWCSQLPGDTKEYATPVGSMEGNEEQYYSDLLYFYDDPHTIYSNWSKDLGCSGRASSKAGHERTADAVAPWVKKSRLTIHAPKETGPSRMTRTERSGQ